MKLFLLIGLLLVVNSFLYTSKDFEKKGKKVRDGVFNPVEAIQLDTVCNDVNLTQSPYNYTGTFPLTQTSSKPDTLESATTKETLPSLSSSTANKEQKKNNSRSIQHWFGSTEDQDQAVNLETSWS